MHTKNQRKRCKYTQKKNIYFHQGLLYPCTFNSTYSFIHIPFSRTFWEGIYSKYARIQLRSRRHLLFSSFLFPKHACVGECDIKGYRKYDQVHVCEICILNVIRTIKFFTKAAIFLHSIPFNIFYTQYLNMYIYVCAYLLVGLLLSVMPAKLLLIILISLC